MVTGHKHVVDPVVVDAASGPLVVVLLVKLMATDSARVIVKNNVTDLELVEGSLACYDHSSTPQERLHAAGVGYKQGRVRELLKNKGSAKFRSLDSG